MKVLLKRILPLTLCFFLLTACGNTMEVLKKQKETDHFIFYSEKEDVDTIDAMAENLEEKYGELLSLFQTSLPEKTDILIFKDRESFRSVLSTKGYPADMPLTSIPLAIACYPNDICILSEHVVGVEYTQDVVRRFQLHEFIHVILHHINPSLPSYLHEGVATYFSDGADDYKVEETLTYALQIDVFPTIRELELMYPYEVNHYQYSCSYVDYVIETYGMETLLNIIKETEDLDYLSIFGVTENEFQENWMKFVEENYMKLNFE